MEQDFNKDNFENWKYGVFYFNRNDHRLIVPKKIESLGRTLNFANPICWVAILIFTALLFYSIFML